MKISIDKASGVQRGLRALDGFERAVKDGERERIVTEHYKLSGPFRLMLAKNMNRIDAALMDFDKARNALFKEKSNGTGEINPKESPDVFMEYQEALREMTGTEVEIELGLIEEAELRLGENQIPASVLSLLIPIIKT